MFIPPWYQQLVVQPIPKLTIKLPYRKLQYPTDVRDIDPYAHIKLFKKAIKTNSEIVEVEIINLFGFTFRDNILKAGENFVENHLITHLKSWNKHFASAL
jgi:uncharacterized heparinase superfamily protein